MNIDVTSVSFELQKCGALVISAKLIKGNLLKVEPLRIWPKRSQLRCFSHVTKISKERNATWLLVATPSRTRSRGQPRIMSFFHIKPCLV